MPSLSNIKKKRNYSSLIKEDFDLFINIWNKLQNFPYGDIGAILEKDEDFYYYEIYSKYSQIIL